MEQLRNLEQEAAKLLKKEPPEDIERDVLYELGFSFDPPLEIYSREALDLEAKIDDALRNYESISRMPHDDYLNYFWVTDPQEGLEFRNWAIDTLGDKIDLINMLYLSPMSREEN